MSNPYPTRAEEAAYNLYWKRHYNRENIQTICDEFAAKIMQMVEKGEIEPQPIKAPILDGDGKMRKDYTGAWAYKVSPMTPEYVAEAIFDALEGYCLNLPHPDR